MAESSVSLEGKYFTFSALKSGIDIHVNISKRLLLDYNDSLRSLRIRRTLTI